MAGTPLKNLRMFQELCGKRALQNVILVTTMWDEIEETVGAQREKELKGKHWKPMIDRGSTTARYRGTFASAWEIVDYFAQDLTRRQAVLLQKEMVDMQKQLRETNAGQELYQTLEALIKKQRSLIHEIRQHTKREGDENMLLVLKAEYEVIRKQLAGTISGAQALRLPLGRRLLRFLRAPTGFMGRNGSVEISQFWADKPTNIRI